jgi:quercetin dioxygenase-like cupin family protein
MSPNVSAAAIALSLVLLTACGDDSSDDAVAAPTPAPAAPVLLGKGLIPGGVKYDSEGPASFSVRIVTLAPGAESGWHVHNGTETSVVTKGELTLFRKGACKGKVLKPGDAVFIPANTPHLARNTGSEPAEISVTYLLKPDAPDRADAKPAC